MKELTERQKQLIQLLSDDEPQKSIASLLGISERTVERQVSTIKIKLKKRSIHGVIKHCTLKGIIN